MEPDLERILIPVVETTVLDSISEEVLWSLRLSIPDERECFEMLLEGNDQRIKVAVFRLIAELDNEKYIPVVKPYSKSDKITFRKSTAVMLDKVPEN